MNTDSTTLYKLMILYMLSKVNFPLSNVQISTFMLDNEYTNYFTFQETINSLVEDSFIHQMNYENSTQYKLTQEGEDTVAFFYTKISPTIRDEIDSYLAKNKYELKSEVGTTSDVPLEEQAKEMCSKWKDSSQDIYEFIMQSLM